MEVLFESNPDKSYYPNANSTMRVAYGQVNDYSPNDELNTNITLLSKV